MFAFNRRSRGRSAGDTVAGRRRSSKGKGMSPKPKAVAGKAEDPVGLVWLEQGKRRLRRAVDRVALRGRPKCDPDIYVTSTLPVQGQTVAVFVSIRKPRTPLGWIQHSLKTFAHDDLVSITFDGRPVPSYPLKRSQTKRDYPIYRALIPTTPIDLPGNRVLEVKVLDDRYRPVKIPCVIQKQVFETQQIWLKGKKTDLLSVRSNGARDKQNKAAFAKIKAWQTLRTSEQLWRGPFVVPSDGVVTTQYGQQRYYNGKFAENYYHKGVDYGADKGSPVSSPAAGRVVLVGLEEKGFLLHGNCIGLDHGQGVASMFMHLDKVNVKVGARVAKGQTLGTVGNTGISTGPHLHWGLFVHGQCVDPYTWMNKDKGHRLLF